MMVFMQGKYCFSVENQTACMRTEITMLHSTERSCTEYLELLLSNVWYWRTTQEVGRGLSSGKIKFHSASMYFQYFEPCGRACEVGKMGVSFWIPQLHTAWKKPPGNKAQFSGIFSEQGDWRVIFWANLVIYLLFISFKIIAVVWIFVSQDWYVEILAFGGD